MSITATYTVSATTLSKTVNDSGLVVAQDDLPKQEELHAKEDTISSNTTPKQHQKRKPVEPLRIDTTTSTSNKRKSSGLFSATSSILSPSTKHVLDLGELDPEEQDALREEIRARKLARKQKKTYADDADDSEDETRINIGTRVSEGHRNYQMMQVLLLTC